jgi:hypothetical protein
MESRARRLLKRLEKKMRRGHRGEPVGTVDYPEGGVCPACPYWTDHDREAIFDA